MTTDAEKIQPALTPDEWSKREMGRGQWLAIAKPFAALGGNPAGSLMVGVGRTFAPIYDRERHAIAALCLHGEPFGFTHADVKLLEDAARKGDSSDAYDMEVLVAKMRALLPPEQPPVNAELKIDANVIGGQAYGISLSGGIT